VTAPGAAGPRLVLFGGVYNNAPALEAVLAAAASRGAAPYCLGDLGGFGPHPDRAIDLLRDAEVPTVQGNYDRSLGARRGDCACGYTDPRDNHFARLSYAYTFQNTSEANKDFLGALPGAIRLVGPGGEAILLCHGSPRRQNEFLWDSAVSDAFLSRLLSEAGCDVLAVTHTGLPWWRRLPAGGLVVNVGAIGRPANDGRTDVWYAELDLAEGPAVEIVPLAYDHERTAAEMRAEGIAEAFVETIETGWWTTCLEILPAKERAAGRW